MALGAGLHPRRLVLPKMVPVARVVPVVLGVRVVREAQPKPAAEAVQVEPVVQVARQPRVVPVAPEAIRLGVAQADRVVLPKEEVVKGSASSVSSSALARLAAARGYSTCPHYLAESPSNKKTLTAPGSIVT